MHKVTVARQGRRIEKLKAGLEPRWNSMEKQGGGYPSGTQSDALGVREAWADPPLATVD